MNSGGEQAIPRRPRTAARTENCPTLTLSRGSEATVVNYLPARGSSTEDDAALQRCGRGALRDGLPRERIALFDFVAVTLKF